jgi:outer membrane protein OmpA-like peptidoglycan-associated protein
LAACKESDVAIFLMKKIQLFAGVVPLLFFLVFFLIATPLWGETLSPKGAITLSPFYGQYELEEDSGDPHFPHRLWGVRMGGVASKRLVVEGWLAYLDDETLTQTGARAGWYLHRVELLYFPGQSKTIIPYIAGGLGGIRFDLKNGNEIGLVADVGAGVAIAFPKIGVVRPTLRIDARSLVRSSRGEMLRGMEATAGFSFEWKPSKKKPLKIAAPIKKPIESGIEDIEMDGFESNDATLSLNQKAILQELATRLRKYPKAMLEVTGHTDNVGMEGENLDLSRKRARVVNDYLVKQGIATERIFLLDAGESKPTTSNRYEPGKVRNRRVTIHVITNPD